MKGMRGIVAAALGLATASTAMAGLPAEFNDRGTFGELRVTTTTGHPLVLRHANVGQGIILGDSTRIDFASVTKLEKQTGNHATAGSIWGSIIGCGIGVVVALGTKETETSNAGMFEMQTTTIQTWPIYAFGLGGSLVGAAIGSTAHTYTTLYHEGATSLSRSDGGLRIGIVPGSGGRSNPPYLALSCSF